MTEQEKLDRAVDVFAGIMKARLEVKRLKGCEGWDKEYPVEHLRRELDDDVTWITSSDADNHNLIESMKTLVDISCRAMFLHYRLLQTLPEPT